MGSTITRTDGSTIEYLSAAETAAMLRKALAKSFPGVKFYVRSRTYAGGASIDVYYAGIAARTVDDFGRVNGVTYYRGAPKKPDVEEIAHAFAGGDFDGMIDLAYNVDRFVDADGNVVGTDTAGTVGSLGSHGPIHDRMPAGSRRVSFGAKHVFVEAELPYDVRTKAAAS